MADFSMERRASWLWTAMIAQPPVATARLVADAVAEAVRRGRAPVSGRPRLEVFDGGDSAQVMHHEVYLRNARRTAPEKLRTILRQPAATG